MAEAAAVGVHVLPGSSLGRLVASTTVDGVTVSIEPHSVQVYNNNSRRFQSVGRALVRSLSPCRWADAALLSNVPEHFGLGRLTEVQFQPFFGYRTFCQNPAEVQQWLPTETRASMRHFNIESLTIHSRQISFVLQSPWIGASEMANGAHLIASIFHGRPMHAPIPVQSAPRRFIHGPTLRMFAAFAVAIVAALAAPGMPFLMPLFSPITCSRGALETTGYRKSGEIIVLRCEGTGGTFRGEAAPKTTYLTIASVAGLITFAAASLVASATRRRD